MHSCNWDDFRYVLAVIEQQSVSGAAKILNVSHTTVLRRINGFEKKYGVRLFERHSSGTVLTAQGEEIFNSALKLKEGVSLLERRITGKDSRLEGRIRLTTCDTLMDVIVPRLISHFCVLNPGITFEVTSGNYVSANSLRDSDISIKTGDNLQEMYYGRRVGNIHFSIYRPALSEFLSDEGVSVFRQKWVVPDITFSGMKISRWIKNHIPETSIQLRADSLISLQRSAEAGVGLTILPDYLGKYSEKLMKIPHTEVDTITSGLWVLTHDDLRHSARIRHFMSFATAYLKGCL